MSKVSEPPPIWKDTATRASAVCRVLENAWAQLRAVLPGLPPDVVIVPFSEGQRRLGHFAACRWRTEGEPIAAEASGAAEVAVHAGLFGSPPELLAVLLHEAAHALLRDTNGGCSGPQGQYHGRSFRDTCQDLGLVCEFVNTRHGFVKTTWPPEGVPARYSPVLDLLQASLPPGAVKAVHLPESGETPLPKPGRVTLGCSCRPPRTLSAARGTADAGRIHCGYCGKEFVGMAVAPPE